MTKSLTISAPGKLMLMGEHAVVYDRPCIVTAVSSRVNATIELNSKNQICINAPEVNIIDYSRPINQVSDISDLPKGARFVEAVIQSMHRQFKLKTGVSITTKNGFSSKYGLGSSSAVSVCVVEAINQFFSLKLSRRQVFDIAYNAVLDVQGVGSGFDVAAAIWGGTLYYVTAGKVIQPLKVKSVPIVVGYSGEKAHTPTVVKKIAKIKDGQPQKFDKMFDTITSLVEKGRDAIESKNWGKLGNLMNQNQQILARLGVSTDTLDSMCLNSLKAQAFGAKLSGAGMGDCMIALTSDENEKSVKMSLKEAGGVLVPVKSGAAGVRVEGSDKKA